MMSPPEVRAYGSPFRHIVARRQALICEHFCAAMPSLGHALPGFLVYRLAGKSGHELAFSGVFQKLFSWMHRVVTLSDASIPLSA
jgi:hypothetical protein